MTLPHPQLNSLLDAIIELLDVPRSLYEQAGDRHQSLGRWLCREQSLLAPFNPDVYLQGSFRYGTVIRPLIRRDEYDLDNVCELPISKRTMTQKQLKELVGYELKGYTEAHQVIAPVEEGNRAWRIDYADQVRFHIDTLPCVPEDPEVIAGQAARCQWPQYTGTAVAITDRRHQLYEQITSDWNSSNPRGFARWFEDRARPLAQERMRQLVLEKQYASADQVPPYEWKTPLQRSIQLLKRHRDAWFLGQQQLKPPISMIVTSLAALAYQGEPDIASALTRIVDGMPNYVGLQSPWIPNPVNPNEDFADAWNRDSSLKTSFWLWHTAIKTDLARLPSLIGKKSLVTEVRKSFQVNLTNDQLERFAPPPTTTPPSTPAIMILSAPKPWQDHG